MIERRRHRTSDVANVRVPEMRYFRHAVRAMPVDAVLSPYTPISKTHLAQIMPGNFPDPPSQAQIKPVYICRFISAYTELSVGIHFTALS